MGIHEFFKLISCWFSGEAYAIILSISGANCHNENHSHAWSLHDFVCECRAVLFAVTFCHYIILCSLEYVTVTYLFGLAVAIELVYDES